MIGTMFVEASAKHIIAPGRFSGSTNKNVKRLSSILIRVINELFIEVNKSA
jgi:hypothetical protein